MGSHQRIDSAVNTARRSAASSTIHRVCQRPGAAWLTATGVSAAGPLLVPCWCTGQRTPEGPPLHACHSIPVCLAPASVSAPWLASCLLQQPQCGAPTLAACHSRPVSPSGGPCMAHSQAGSSTLRQAFVPVQQALETPPWRACPSSEQQWGSAPRWGAEWSARLPQSPPLH